jgi:cytochrome c2
VSTLCNQEAGQQRAQCCSACHEASSEQGFSKKLSNWHGF